MQGSDAGGPVSHLSDEQGCGQLEMREHLRPDARCGRGVAAGVRVRLLSGDRPDAVRRVGQLAGIDDVQGSCLPDDKLAQMRQAQGAGAVVAMVGDGLNDGPVLAGADVSFAFGHAVPLARAQADFVVLGEAWG